MSVRVAPSRDEQAERMLADPERYFAEVRAGMMAAGERGAHLVDQVDRLRSVWSGSPSTREFIEQRYPGLAHAIEGVVTPPE